uniref:WD repeat-containing protein CG11141 isoform X1 n=2 Tax=Vespula vulgaris TaxID=7454 RepID=UPI00223B5FE0|nr:WD repeat-containing protein CG11141 isoform X1 [Vespula vulgaris]
MIVYVSIVNIISCVYFTGAMTTPMCEDVGPLREWAPLAALLQKIPAKIQNGLFTYDVNFTCIDVVPEFIAVGTNVGIIYWYNREIQDLQKLRCESINSKITCLRVISTVDYMVAAGNEHGVVTVFQIPKNLPDTLPDCMKPKQMKQIEKYNISGLHKGVVTTVEWSKNGMKLFSGDQNGLVVLTEIDFYMHLSKSIELLNEKYSIVQLNYQQGLLLVSTILRTILVNRNEGGKVIQVGQKERKNLGKLGAVFGFRQNRPQDLVIYASRPGLRLWEADQSGIVSKTLIFKDAIRSVHTEVKLLNPAPESAKKNRGEPTFGIMLPFSEDLLLTYSDNIIYVVNPRTIAITSVVTDVRRVTDVACTKDEIFILEGDRNIIRIAYFPDTSAFKDSTSPFPELSKSVTAGIMELTNKLRETAIMPAIPFHKINPTSIIQSVSITPNVNTGTETNIIADAEEAMEIPRVVPIDLDTRLLVDINKIAKDEEAAKKKEDEKQNLRRQIFEKISQQEFEDVVFTPEKKNKKLRSKSQNRDKPQVFPCNEIYKASCSAKNEVQSKITYSSYLSTSIDDEFMLTSKRNLESIQRDVENKEKLLADILDLDLSKYKKDTDTINEEIDTTNVTNLIDIDSRVICLSESYNFSTELNIYEKNEDNQDSDHTLTESEDDEASYRTELKKLEDLEECRKELLQSKLKDRELITLEDLQDTPHHSKGINHHDLEAQFTVLSEEVIASAILEDEDWVVVKTHPKL